MKKITLCAAAVAAVTGMTAITSQAAVITYVTGGNCGDFNVNGNGFSGNIFSDNNCGSMGNQFYGSGCSGDQILEMLVPSVSGSSCGDMWDGGCVSVLPGIQNFPLIPGCSGTEGDILRPNLPSPDCPVTPSVQFLKIYHLIRTVPPIPQPSSFCPPAFTHCIFSLFEL